jgi:polyisoprenoid-binding protein YceI
MKKKNISGFAFLLFISFNGFTQTSWVLDKSHSDIRFTVTHMMISEVDGKFSEFDATVSGGDENFVGSNVEFSTKVSSIDTDNERRDDHLKSPDFFDEPSFPKIKFKGKILKEDDHYILAGDFTIKDITRSVEFDLKYNGQIPGGRGKKAGFKVTGTIDRFDYGLTWNRTIETGGLVVSREVEITCNVQLNEVVE